MDYKKKVAEVIKSNVDIELEDIEKLTVDEVVEKVRNILNNYQPRMVRRKEIPKPNGKTRPLGIPCMWDRIVQQAIKQVIEPICEAKFVEQSYGFRPLRSTENAVATAQKLLSVSKAHYVVEIDIKGFFDNVDHSKLMKQIWTIGIHDKQLICIIKKILKADILLENGEILKPKKGTPQGGIISPLLANIALNEFDHWINSQWVNNPIADKYAIHINKNGTPNKGNGYTAMRKTNLKEVYLVRYADDVRLFCKNQEDANNIMLASKKWLNKRLKLQCSEEKTRVINTRTKYSEFLGFKMKVKRKGNKWVITSHVCDKALERLKMQLKEQVKAIAKPPHPNLQPKAICLYNAMVRGIHNYYSMATEINADMSNIQNEIGR